MTYKYQDLPCRILSSRTIFGKKVCSVYVPETGKVEEVLESALEIVKEDRLQSKEEIRSIAAAGKVFEALNNYRQEFGEDVLLAPLDSAVTPLPHQLDTLKKAIAKPQVRLLFADEVGLGKTIEAGLVIREMKLRGLVKRILIVAPTGLAKQWISEMKVHFNEDFHLFLPSQVEAASDLLKAARGHLELAPDEEENPYLFCDQVVCPLDAIKPLRRRRGWTKEQVDDYNARRFLSLLHADWDLVVIDEAHRVAGADESVSRHRLGRGLGEATPNILLLSATPHQGKSDAFRRLMSIIDPEAFPDNEAVTRSQVEKYLIRHEKRTTVDGFGRPLFRPRHTQTVSVAWGWNCSGQRQLYAAVTEYLKTTYSLAARMTRSKRVMIGFLLVLIQRLATSSTMALSRFLEKRMQYLQDASSRIDEVSQEEAADEFAADEDAERQIDILARVRAAMGDENERVEKLLQLSKTTLANEQDAKVDYLFQLMDRLQDQEHDEPLKVLIFTEFTATQEMLANVFRQHGISNVQINGSMSMDERLANQRAFADHARVLISTEAGGEGLNLQFCHVVVNYDMPWNPMRIEQRIGRVDRIGQKKDVQAFNFTLAETVENHVREVLEDKLRVILGDLGVDKLGDILDSSATDIPFDDVYTAGFRSGGDETQNAIDSVEKAIKNAAKNAKQFAALYQTQPVSAELADRYLHHPFPYWVERMMVDACHAQGGVASRNLFGWTLEFPGREKMENVVFGIEDLGNTPSSTFLSINQPDVRMVLDRLVRNDVDGPQIARISCSALPPGVNGTFVLCRINAKGSSWAKNKIVPCFISGGVVQHATARSVYDNILSGNFSIAGQAPFSREEVLALLEPWLMDGFAELENMYKTDRSELFEKKHALFQSHGKTISRIGLDNVRRAKFAKLQAEQDAFEKSFNADHGLVPGIGILLAVDVVGGCA